MPDFVQELLRRKCMQVVGTGLALLSGVQYCALPALAQGPQVLPPVIVEGATREAPAPRKRAKPVQPQPSAASVSTGEATNDELGAFTDGEPAAGGDFGATVSRGSPSYSVGTSVFVVTGEDLVEQQSRNASDGLRNLPGVTVNRGGGEGGLTDVRIRGGEANHTLVLIDGIPANDPTTGSFDFSNLTADGIERMEIIRGPQSGLYGSNALSGVVNIITKKGTGPLKLTAQFEAGAFETKSVGVGASAGNDNIWFSFGHRHHRVDGFNMSPFGLEADPSRISNTFWQGGFRPLSTVTVDYTLRHVAKRADRDAFDGPTGALATAFDDGSDFENAFSLGGAKATWQTLGGSLTHVFSASGTRTSLVDRDVTSFFRSDNVGAMRKAGYLATYRFATPGVLPLQHSVTGLFEQQADFFTPRSDFADGETRSRRQVAAGGEYRVSLAERLFLSGVLRHDNNETFDDYLTWRGSLSVRLEELGLRPHASIGTGVKLPTMLEQFGFFGSFLPNPNLRPETSLGWDVGLEFNFWSGRGVLDVTYFKQDVEDKIRTNATFTGAENIEGESLREGVEVAARWRVSGALTLSAAYTYLEASDADGLREARRPDHSARVDASYGFNDGKGLVRLTAAYMGETRDDAFRVNGRSSGFPILSRENVFLDDYVLLSAAASYRISDTLEVFARVNNIFDTSYREQFSFNTPGIAAYAGFKISFEDRSRP